MQIRLLQARVFRAGRLALTAEQAAARAHQLAPMGGNEYEPIAPVEFKAGEVIGYVGEMDRALQDVCEVLEVPAPAQGQPKAEAPEAAPAKRGRRRR